MKQKFKVGEYAIDKYDGIIRINDAEETVKGNWVYNVDSKIYWQKDLDKWEPQAGEKVITDIRFTFQSELDYGYTKKYTVVLEIVEVLDNNVEFKMSDKSILHITDIRPYTGKF